MAATEQGEKRGVAAVLDTVEVQRKYLRDELKLLDTMAVKLGGGPVEEAPKPTAASAVKPQPKGAKSRKGTKVNSPAAAAERVETLARFLGQQSEPVPSGTIQRELNFSVSEVKTAVRRLEEAGRLVRTGEGASTLYSAKGSDAPSAAPKPTPLTPPSPTAATAPPPVPKAPSSSEGTLNGRVLARVQGTEFSTLADLAEFTGSSNEDALRECGLLIREGEIRMERRGGQPGYVPA